LEAALTGAGFGRLDWTILVVYLLVNLLLGFFMSRRVESARDFQLGTGTTPWWALGVSVIATYVSALSFLGGPAWAYGDGMAALAIHVNYPLVIFVVVVVFLPFFFNSGVASIYEYLERRFGVASRTVMAGLFLVSQTITTASILTATAVTITYATGLGVRTSIVLMTLTTLFYTMLGGMNAVIWTDVLQAVVLFVGAGIVLWKAMDYVSPLSDAMQTLASAGRLDPINTSLDFSVAPTIWAGVFAMTLFHITVYGGNQMMVQRALAARSLGDAKKSYLMMGFAGFFIYFLFFFIGALLYVYFKGRPFEQPNEIILVFAQALALPGLLGVIAAAVLAASMSSLSSAFNSLATISITDFYQRFFRSEASDAHYLGMSRAFTVLWALAAVPVAFAFVGSGGSILERLSQVASYFVGAQLAMFGMGFLSKHTTERGLLVGVAAGFAGLYLVVSGLPFLGWHPAKIAWPWYVVIGGTINIVVSWTASIVLDGWQTDWHEQTVPGQIRRFRAQGLPVKQEGWYVVPGRVDPACWALLVFFLLTLAFLAVFATLGDKT
jgi:SSS family solute:Na+ symporter